MTTDHEANVLGDAWCEIDQWRPILWEARQHQNLWPAYWLNHNLDISDSYNAYLPISYKTDWIVTYFFNFQELHCLKQYNKKTKYLVGLHRHEHQLIIKLV